MYWVLWWHYNIIDNLKVRGKHNMLGEDFAIPYVNETRDVPRVVSHFGWNTKIIKWVKMYKCSCIQVLCAYYLVNMHWETWLPGNNKKNSIQLGGNEANKMQAGYKHKYVLFSWELVANNSVAHILNFKLIFATGPNHNKSYEEDSHFQSLKCIVLHV